MARPKKYSKSSFEQAVNAYFDGISRLVEATEWVPSGKKDENGHEIMTPVLIKNRRGEVVMVEDFIVPPTLGGICEHLGITRETWRQYEKDKQFSDTVTRARGRVESYLEQELTRRQKGVDGIKFNLMHNFGWADKHEVEAGAKTRDAMKPMTMAEKLAAIREATEFFQPGEPGSQIETNQEGGDKEDGRE